jgi:glycosyltransferase involved in cell wall biosynthesis
MKECNSSDALSSKERLRSIERRLTRLERQSDVIIGIARAGIYKSWRRRFRPRLWDLAQYSSRRIRIPPEYHLEKAPENAPRIAIVTPSFNQGNLIAATVDSVLKQNYPDVVYLVQDGASTDNTTEVLESYSNSIRWRSEPDTGQGQAINRGFREIEGDIMAYLNSDDIFLPGTLAYVARVFRENPETDIIYGHRVYIDLHGFEIGRCVLPPHDAETLKWGDYIPQETLFWRRRVWQAIGSFDESFDFALDWDFILRAQAAGFSFKRLPRFLSCFRVHNKQKNIYMGDIGEDEMRRIRTRYLGDAPGQYEIKRAIMPYLLRQMFFDWMYRLRLYRY